MTLVLTDRQREVMEHALGIKGSWGKRPYRNHYCCGPGHTGWDPCNECVANGWMCRHEPKSWLPDWLFEVTPAGRAMLGLKEETTEEMTR